MMPANLTETEFAVEFAHRTLRNYRKYKGDYEITQLVNSLLGVLVVPRETFYEKKPITAKLFSDDLIQELQEGILENAIGDEEMEIDNISEILRHMRNAICHGGILFCGEYPSYTNKPVEIKEIEFTDDYGDSYFKIRISITTLVRLLQEFYDAIEKKYGQSMTKLHND